VAALDAEVRGRVRAWLACLDAAAAGEAGVAAATAPPSPDGPLTARELEVLARIAAGDSNKLVARALDLSLHTVKRHVANILAKLDVATRAQAADWYRGRQA
jgi:LuxR family maltose regulon positive regulatory protein